MQILIGADLRCGQCGAGAEDVAPDFSLVPQEDDLLLPVRSETYWHCTNGHRQTFTWERPHGP